MFRLSFLSMLLACGATLPQAVMARSDHAPVPADRQQPVALQRNEARSTAEVARLRKDVARQEARSREADQRLHEQDLALERLRRALQAAEQQSGADAAGP